MATHCPPPHPDPSVSSVRLPAGATDSHCHIFGPDRVFPYAPDRRYTPPDVSRHDLRRRHDHLGLGRAVIVQSAVHGTDHAALLDALRADPDRYRGVAVINEATPDREIAELHEAGVRGFRLSFLPHLGPGPSPETIDALLRKVAPYGWHLQLHVAGDGIRDLAGRVRTIDVPVVIDHMARVDLDQGLDSPAVRTLLGLLDDGAYVKLSGSDRLSRTGPPYDDSVALAHLLAGRAPTRILWGTDFPHPNITGPSPDDGALVDLLARITPDEEARHRLLVTNPAELYGFPA